MSAAEEAAKKYLDEVRQIRSTGHATDELSYYPPLNAFLTELIAGQRPVRRALNHPQGIEGDFPDVSLYEDASKVLVLPFEVKGAGGSMDQLVSSEQARRYAKSFGGGQVMLTNLHEFVLARLEGNQLVAVESVHLVPDEELLDHAAGDLGNAPRDLALLLQQACQVRGNLIAPKLVASFLAFHGRHMRESIKMSGDPVVLLGPIRRALSDGLQIELTPELLVATVVQTLVYGLFAAWLDDPNPSDFDWMESAYRLDVPVFADVLYATLRPALLRQCNLKQHLDAVARVLMWVDRDAFTEQFDGGAIEYFYEPFLAEFDEELRDKLGVWYTPKAIAEYQVARTDHHLKTDLGIAAGIADPTVYVLDPACGTGTYLAAVLRHIYATHLANHEPPSVALERVREAALTRVLGFEILPAAFIICHLHLTRLLRQLGVESLNHQRLRVYLTNALTGWTEEGAPVGATLFPQLEQELHDAAIVKHTEPVLAIIGNPPYQGYSSAETDEEKEMLRAWIEPLWPVWKVRKHRMNDLYVRFWRVSIEKIASLTGKGIVSFITNRKWLGGRSYPTMRQAVATSFQTVVVDDLHGAADDSSHPNDRSVFSTNVAAGIKRGTAIVTAVRTGPLGDDESSVVSLRDFWGGADTKRAKLDGLALADIDQGLEVIPVSADSRWRFVRDAGGDFASVSEYLTFFCSGVQPVRDEAVVAFTKEELKARMLDYFDSDLSLTELVEKHPGFGVTRSRYNAETTRAKLLANSAFDEDRLVPFLYRPFDVRWLYWEPDYKLLNEARRQLIPYWLAVPEQKSLVLPQTPRRVGAFRPVVSSAVACMESAEPNARIFPLFGPGEVFHGVGGSLGSGESTPEAVTLVGTEWLSAARSLGTSGSDIEVGTAIFNAMVCVMNSPEWLATHAVESDDFPAVPLPSTLEDFNKAVDIGNRIAALNDPRVEVPGVTFGSIEQVWAAIGVPDVSSGHVELAFGTFGSTGGKRVENSVLWDDGYGWRNIPADVWNFASCGHAVLPKWLSYRKRVGLSSADRETFMLLCRRIAAIRALEGACNSIHLAAADAPLLPPPNPA